MRARTGVCAGRTALRNTLSGSTNINIAQNLADIRLRIKTAAIRSGRDHEAVTLVAVTKTVGPPQVAEAHDAGISDFGESYVQEALSKQRDPALARRDIRWHFIGHLQGNKVRDVVGRFEIIQSVDSMRLAQEISKRAIQAGHSANILLQVKLDPDRAKFGIEPGDTLLTAEQAGELPGITLVGLMGMAPFAEDPEQSRVYFRSLRVLFEALPSGARRILSMGMTGDFEVAVEEGATLVRIGTAIFGSRTRP